MTLRVAAVSIALAGPAAAAPALTCETAEPGQHWGLDLLGPVAVWRQGAKRETFHDLGITALANDVTGWVGTFSANGKPKVAIVTEAPCTASGSFPLSLVLLDAADAAAPVLRGCCTVAE
jgi:hypothetical protein